MGAPPFGGDIITGGHGITADHGILFGLAISHDAHLRQVRWRRRWCHHNNRSRRGRRPHRLGDYPTDIPLADTTIWLPTRFNPAAEEQGQFADIRRQQNFLRLFLRDFQRDRLSDFRLFFSFARYLVDRKHLYVLQQNVGVALAPARYFVSDHDDNDEVAWQHEPCNPTHVIDAHRHGAFALV